MLVGVSGCALNHTFQQEIDTLTVPVAVFSPQVGDVLVAGQPLTVDAMLRLSKIDFAVDTIQVRLWHIYTKEEYILYVDQAPSVPNTATVRFKQSVTIPAAIPPGDDYRLSISGRSADKTVGRGYTVPVKVIQAP